MYKNQNIMLAVSVSGRGQDNFKRLNFWKKFLRYKMLLMLNYAFALQ